MSQSSNPLGEEQLKNIIHHLYVVKGCQLPGPQGLMKLMEDKHGFKATKGQYEKLFKDWGFVKKRKNDDYKILGRKLEGRKKRGRESDIYQDGELVPRKKVMKEISRQGYMTVSEQLNQAQVTTPRTPHGFQICTPAAGPLRRLIFRNLPILQFQESRPSFGGTFKEFDHGMTSLVTLIGSREITSNTDPIMSFIDAFLPNSALLEEDTASGLAIERLEKIGSVEFLNLTTFLISNNFPGESKGNAIYKWLKSHGGSSVLDALSSMGGLTAKALLENLFRLAVEDGDTPIVKYLLKVGVNPNGHKCKHEKIPDSLDPLQFACITGSSEMVSALIEAGSTVAETKSGWKSSILVLAIIGENRALEWRFEKDDDEDGFIQSEVQDTYEEDTGGEDTDEEDTHEEDTGDATEKAVKDERRRETENQNRSLDDEIGFLGLIKSLVDAGAKINLGHSDARNESEKSQTADDFPGCLQDDHSPLTAASKYRHKDLVNMLLQIGANVKYLTIRGTSALQECLYSHEEMEEHIWNYDQFFPLPGRGGFGTRSAGRNGNIVSIVQRLLDAGADQNISTFYVFTEDDEDDDHRGQNVYLTPLDLAALAGMRTFVEILLGAGAEITERCLEFAIDARSVPVFERLLESGASLSGLQEVAVLDMFDDHGMDEILRRQPNSLTKALAMVAAIRFDAMYLMENLLELGTFEWSTILNYPLILEFAISKCVSGPMEVFRAILRRSTIPQSKIAQYLNLSLKEAVLRGNIVNFDFLYSFGADINAKIANETVLLVAINSRNKTLTKRLIKLGAILNGQADCCIDLSGYHKPSGAVFIAAIEWGDDDVIGDLLRHGVDVNAPGSTNYFAHECICTTPLVALIEKKSWDWVDYLIQIGANVNNPPEISRWTPLAAALHRQNIYLARRLLESGADPDWQALREATAYASIFQLLVTNFRDKYGWQNENTFGRPALDKAIGRSDTAMVRTILESRLVDVNVKWNESRALHEALVSASDPNLDILRMLLASGADANEIVFGVDSNSRWNPPRSALLVAINRGIPQEVDMLLQAGAQPNRSLVLGMRHTGLQEAVYGKGNKDIIRLLLNYGADPNAFSPFGESSTPIQLAAERNHRHIIEDLLKHKASPDAITGNARQTALQISAREGYKEIVEILIEHGANVNSPAAEESGATALQYTALGGFLGIAYLLLENGAEVNAPAAAINGRTALEGAAEHGRIDVVQLLLNAGAEVYGNGEEQYKRALELASGNGHHATRQLLEEYHG